MTDPASSINPREMLRCLHLLDEAMRMYLQNENDTAHQVHLQAQNDHWESYVALCALMMNKEIPEPHGDNGEWDAWYQKQVAHLQALIDAEQEAPGA